jgi:hypothetical protein
MGLCSENALRSKINWPAAPSLSMPQMSRVAMFERLTDAFRESAQLWPRM